MRKKFAIYAQSYNNDNKNSSNNGENSKETIDLTKAYAGQIVDVARNSVRFNITDKLAKLNNDNTEKPFLNILSDFSVYRLSIFTYKEGSVEANIPIDDIALLNERTRITSEYLFRELNGLNSSGTSKNADGNQEESILPDTPAFTYKMKMGNNMKGKTPVEFIAENQERWKEARTELENQVAYLKKNADKYPENRKAMEAIQEALNLVAQKKLTKAMSDEILSKEDSGEGPSFAVYSPQTKYFTRDLGNKVKKCYHVEIICYPKDPYPYRISIKNFLAPITESHMIQMSAIVPDSMVTKSFRLTEQEWLNALYVMTRNMEEYRMCLYTHMRRQDEERRFRPNQNQQAVNRSSGNRR